MIIIINANIQSASRMMKVRIRGYSTYTERRAASETAIEFALLSF